MVLKEYGGVQVKGPLGPLALGFALELTEQGYTRLSTRNQLGVFAFVSRWLERFKLGPAALGPESIAAILRARKHAGYTCWLSPRGLAPMLAYLRKLGVSPQLPQPAATWRTRLLDRYCQHLRSQCGLSSGTVSQRENVAKAFLADRHCASSVRKVRVVEIRRFFQNQARGHSSPSAAGVASALRSFLRYLHLVGEVDSSLIYAVPSIAAWRLTGLPRGVSAQVVKRLLDSCDRRSIEGHRDFAILMLMSRLGLRCCEVARLTLEDVDWRRAEITVRGKAHHMARLPLPQDVGSALAAYVKRRGAHVYRVLFLRGRAPIGPVCTTTLAQVLRKASRRAGVANVSAHQLRHTVATQMLRRGSTLAEIAQVLRHASVATTAIYAKVDRSALRELAQSWPAGAV